MIQCNYAPNWTAFNLNRANINCCAHRSFEINVVVFALLVYFPPFLLFVKKDITIVAQISSLSFGQPAISYVTVLGNTGDNSYIHARMLKQLCCARAHKQSKTNNG